MPFRPICGSDTPRKTIPPRQFDLTLKAFDSSNLSELQRTFNWSWCRGFAIKDNRQDSVSRFRANVWVCYSVKGTQESEVTDRVWYLVACCDRRPLIWRRCGGASRGVFCPGTSPQWPRCRWAGSCKGSPPRRTALNMSGGGKRKKSRRREIYIGLILHVWKWTFRLV